MKVMFFMMSMMLMSHPISIIIYILAMSMMFLSILVFFTKSSWFSMIFMIMMLGGLMVLFIYMASLSSNEYMKFMKGWNLGLVFVFFFLPFLEVNINMSEYMIMTMFYKNSLLYFLFYLVYLFIILILIIELLVSVKSSLRLEV
nr:NADH dehydrogenase subunit 6 [Laelaps sp. 1 JO-2023a]